MNENKKDEKEEKNKDWIKNRKSKNPNKIKDTRDRRKALEKESS